MKPKMLFVGHTYHKKTKSSQFMQDIFAKYYDIENFHFDPYTEDIQTAFSALKGKKFDVVVLWQIMPSLTRLKRYISFKHCVFFPMYDGAIPRDNLIWNEYRDVNIINFSKTLDRELKDLGFSTFYVQYFPKPIKITNRGDIKSVFFWQRTNDITINTVGKLIDLKKIKHIHMHRAIDPNQTFVEPPKEIAKKVTYSNWFDTREEMQDKMQESAIYIAPRAYEGIGMSFLEAMAMGRVVVAPNNPTMNEYITSGVNGILYDLNSPAPIDLSNVKEIQNNTIEYINNGFKVWEKMKLDIVGWLTKKPRINRQLLDAKYNKPEIDYAYYLFGMLPVIRVVGRVGHIMYKLFGVIPCVLSKGQGDGKRIYVFGIPVLKIKG